MFFSYNDSSIRYTGRFAKFENTMTATATGSTIEIAFSGRYILLHFNVDGNEIPMPHLWISVDGKEKFEVPLDRFLRVEAGDGDHVLTVILKGAKEQQARFFHPLVGKVSFAGYDAEKAGILPPDDRKTIEFVGDSITEGVLIDEFLRGDGLEEQDNRPLQDDVTATYAYLTAQALNLKDLHMGYGAVGVTKAGCGAVPKAAEAYPYCFEGAPVTYDHPDYILINHGANDQKRSVEEYLTEYENLLDTIRSIHPSSRIISLSAFCGVYPNELGEMIDAYNKKHNDNIAFIDSTGWIPAKPLHPARDGHMIVSQHLVEELKKII